MRTQARLILAPVIVQDTSITSAAPTIPQISCVHLVIEVCDSVSGKVPEGATISNVSSDSMLYPSFGADPRFEVLWSQTILTIAYSMKILVCTAAPNPNIKVRRAASTGRTIVLIYEEFLQIWAVENPADWNGLRKISIGKPGLRGEERTDSMARESCDCERILIGAAAASKFSSCGTKMHTSRMGNCA